MLLEVTLIWRRFDRERSLLLELSREVWIVILLELSDFGQTIACSLRDRLCLRVSHASYQLSFCSDVGHQFPDREGFLDCGRLPLAVESVDAESEKLGNAFHLGLFVVLHEPAILSWRHR